MTFFWGFAALTMVVGVAHGFSSALFQQAPTMQKTSPSKTVGVDIELPDFDELFDRIQQVSPLARSVIANKNSPPLGGPRGFAAVDDSTPKSLAWNTVEKNPRKLVHQIDKIDNFNGHPAPLLRFRSSFTGPCVGEYFADFIMSLDRRSLWDPQIEQVYEIYPMHDLDSANIATGSVGTVIAPSWAWGTVRRSQTWALPLANN